MGLARNLGLARLPHGGDLAAARRRFPDAPEPLIDLSTGINPHPYPLPPLTPDLFTRLPEPEALAIELEHGLLSLADVQAGLERFRAGAGRHGAFD